MFQRISTPRSEGASRSGASRGVAKAALLGEHFGFDGADALVAA
jgi:hypothetical protein